MCSVCMHLLGAHLSLTAAWTWRHGWCSLPSWAVRPSRECSLLTVILSPQMVVLPNDRAGLYLLKYAEDRICCSTASALWKASEQNSLYLIDVYFPKWRKTGRFFMIFRERWIIVKEAFIKGIFWLWRHIFLGRIIAEGQKQNTSTCCVTALFGLWFRQTPSDKPPTYQKAWLLWGSG